MIGHALVLLVATTATVPAIGGKVDQAAGLDLPGPVARFNNTIAPPSLVPVRVAGRKVTVIREWRDPLQTYSVVWTARTGGYQAMQIRGDRYDEIPGDTVAGRPILHDYGQATAVIYDHWRFLNGRAVHKPPIDVNAQRAEARRKLAAQRATERQGRIGRK
ncbi:MAG: hypothetical protein AB7O59_01050 [Pirellulales bacterium]